VRRGYRRVSKLQECRYPLISHSRLTDSGFEGCLINESSTVSIHQLFRAWRFTSVVQQDIELRIRVSVLRCYLTSLIGTNISAQYGQSGVCYRQYVSLQRLI